MDPGLRRDDALKDEQPSRRPILKLQTRHIRKVILIVGDDHGVETQRMCCQQAVEARTPDRKPRIGASSRLIERDRKSAVKGKSVSVRVDLGGRRNMQKKTNKDYLKEAP